ncbi:MAG: hypothetical protein KDD63_18890 [Bacteroidetes bacterium]|nr:hypothetical protein [Bacteroidota bacterium]
MNFLRLFFLCFLVLMSFHCADEQTPTKFVSHGKVKRKRLKPVYKIQNANLNESSGMVKSRRFEGVFWSHNDSGDKARIFALNAEGETISDSLNPSDVGIRIRSLKNNDWEDLGWLENKMIISDMGNNQNNRDDLGFIIVSEPNPYTDSVIPVATHYKVKYPDQGVIPLPWDRNFDCEAIFGFQDNVYILSKNRSDENTKLYRFESLQENEVNIPTLIDRFQTEGKVTSASMSEDESQLVVLTYQNVWLFKGFQGDDFFDHEVYFYRLDARQCEAIDFLSDSTLIITNEQKHIFYLDIEELIKLR